jgi:hypothetical protein
MPKNRLKSPNSPTKEKKTLSTEQKSKKTKQQNLLRGGWVGED